MLNLNVAGCERSGTGVKTTSGTGERRMAHWRFASYTSYCHASISREKNDRIREKEETVLQLKVTKISLGVRTWLKTIFCFKTALIEAAL